MTHHGPFVSPLLRLKAMPVATDRVTKGSAMNVPCETFRNYTFESFPPCYSYQGRSKDSERNGKTSSSTKTLISPHVGEHLLG